MKNNPGVAQFRKLVWGHYKREGRDLPWRRTANPYCIVVSEFMLQQTQVARVLIKYPPFLTEFPTWHALAEASVADVLRAWQGLGYNRRALALKKTAEVVVKDYGGKLPSEKHFLVSLPGIGDATAGAIVAFAFNKPVVFIETNIRRTYIHHFFPDSSVLDAGVKSQNHAEGSGLKFVRDQDLLPIIERTVDKKNPREWYYALMDYGSRLAKEHPNPNRRSVHYVRQSIFEGSDRQMRARIVRRVLQKPATVKGIASEFGAKAEHIEKLSEALRKEGLLIKKGATLLISS